MPPYRAVTARTHSAAAAASVTSSARTSTSTPPAAACSRSRSARPGSRIVATTCRPACASPTAVCRPIPLDVPVTNATRGPCRPLLIATDSSPTVRGAPTRSEGGPEDQEVTGPAQTPGDNSGRRGSRCRHRPAGHDAVEQLVAQRLEVNAGQAGEGAGEPGDALVESGAPVFDQPVGVEDQDVAGVQTASWVVRRRDWPAPSSRSGAACSVSTVPSAVSTRAAGARPRTSAGAARPAAAAGAVQAGDQGGGHRADVQTGEDLVDPGQDLRRVSGRS